MGFSIEFAEETQQYQDYIGKTLAAEQIAEWERTTGYSQLSYKEREALWRDKAIENAVAAKQSH